MVLCYYKLWRVKLDSMFLNWCESSDFTPSWMFHTKHLKNLVRSHLKKSKKPLVGIFQNCQITKPEMAFLDHHHFVVISSELSFIPYYYLLLLHFMILQELLVKTHHKNSLVILLKCQKRKPEMVGSLDHSHRHHSQHHRVQGFSFHYSLQTSVPLK